MPTRISFTMLDWLMMRAMMEISPVPWEAS